MPCLHFIASSSTVLFPRLGRKHILDWLNKFKTSLERNLLWIFRILWQRFSSFWRTGIISWCVRLQRRGRWMTSSDECVCDVIFSRCDVINCRCSRLSNTGRESQCHAVPVLGPNVWKEKTFCMKDLKNFKKGAPWEKIAKSGTERLWGPMASITLQSFNSIGHVIREEIEKKNC